MQLNESLAYNMGQALVSVLPLSFFYLWDFGQELVSCFTSLTLFLYMYQMAKQLCSVINSWEDVKRSQCHSKSNS